MLKNLLFITILLFLTERATSQNDAIGYGFRAGISLAKFDGPPERGLNGEILETNKMASGFHIGAQFHYKFGDLMGLRAELLFSQRGTDYLYDGPSYFVLGRNTLLTTTIMGTRRQSVNVSNAYIDVPLTLYYKIKSFEISGGVNLGLLISSAAGGTIKFDGVSPNTGKPLAPFTIDLNYNYKKDKAGEASATTQQVNVDGRNYDVPTFIGAYYEFPEKDKSKFKTLDFGLVAGLSYYPIAGLYIGAQYIYGLGDVDRNDYDVSLRALNTDGTFIPKNTDNKSRSWQFSVGFSF